MAAADEQSSAAAFVPGSRSLRRLMLVGEQLGNREDIEGLRRR